MRSPVLVFSFVAASALTPTILGSPLPAHNAVLSSADHYRPEPVARGLGFLSDVFARADGPPSTPNKALLAVADKKVGRSEFWKKDDGRVQAVSFSHNKRLDDSQTEGGNAQSGSSGAVDGGSVANPDNSGMPTIMNVDSMNGGNGGGSTTGCAAGGKGTSGGNASSGDSGTARGGKVSGSGGMVNVNSDNAGNAGKSSTGCAEGGNGNGKEAETSSQGSGPAGPSAA